MIEDAQPERFLKRCPYCGITLPKTHDHYLPEVSFPELSVHALNLIPCCDECNKIKNNFWKNNKHRVFLHFYSDFIPEEKYLKVNLYSNDKVNAIGAVFYMEKPANVKEPVWFVLEAHYERLKLISRYNELANDEITEIFNNCVSHIKNEGVNIEGFLKYILNEDETLYGSNHWRVVLMKSLSESNVFFNAVKSV